jgi:hypothetical protein
VVLRTTICAPINGRGKPNSNDAPFTIYLYIIERMLCGKKNGAGTPILRRTSATVEFFLDVTDVNISAQKSYQAFGFVESHRVPEKHPKQRGFNSRIYMKYRIEPTKEIGEGSMS